MRQRRTHIFSREGLRRAFIGAEEGAALTEFVLTLPIFLIIMAGLISLGQVGASSVVAKTHAYSAMWGDTIVRTTDDWKAMTPRSKLDNPLKQVVTGVVGGAVGGIIDGLPGDLSNPIPGVTAGEGADGVIGAQGHWGEAEYFGAFAESVTGGIVDHRAENYRLSFVDTAPGAATHQILGPSGSTKPRLALDDNLMSNTAFNEFQLTDLWADPVSFNDLIKNIKSTLGRGAKDMLSDFISASGFAPGLMAGIRYGRGVGFASSEVEFTSKVFNYKATHHGLYMTAPSPNTMGPLNSEKVHWLFYVGGSQLNPNQRNMLNLLKANLKTSDQTAPNRYWYASGGAPGTGSYGGGSGGGTR